MKRILSVLILLGPLAGPVLAEDSRPVTYSGQIAPLFSQRCLDCHGADAPTLAEFDKDKAGWKQKNRGPRMDSHERLLVFINGSDAGALMRRLDDGKHSADGKPGNMYVNLGDTDAERAANLAVIRRWVGPGAWILKKRPQWTDAEIRSVRATR